MRMATDFHLTALKAANFHSTALKATLRGHAERVCRIQYHPSGRFLGSASFDKTWRLWDVATQQEILCQEG